MASESSSTKKTCKMEAGCTGLFKNCSGKKYGDKYRACLERASIESQQSKSMDLMVKSALLQSDPAAYAEQVKTLKDQDDEGISLGVLALIGGIIMLVLIVIVYFIFFRKK